MYTSTLMRRWVAGISIGLGATICHGQVVLRVDDDAPAGGDGLTWATAFRDLQDALAAAAAAGSGVDEVWVAEGTYVPHPSDATVSFRMQSGLALYGGFGGWESQRGQRSWQAHETILSGDIGGDDVVGSGRFWYLSWNINTANSGHVVDAAGTDATAVLDGFTVTAGHTGPPGTPSSSPLMHGSGVYAFEGSPTITNCTFTHNLAAFNSGGAILVWDGSPAIDNCRFLENYTHLGHGGAIYVGGASQPLIADCLFRFNVCVGGSIEAAGAGLSYWGSAPFEVARCVFDRNLARPFSSVGGGIGWAGGVFNFTGPIALLDCVFTGNTATYGGGMVTLGPGSAVNCLFSGNASVPHPNDPYPELGGEGAALVAGGFQAVAFDVVNCTVADNHGKKYAVYGGNNQEVAVANSIIWGNTATHPEITGTYRAQIGGSFSARYSCIDLIFDPPGPGEKPLDPADIPGCIDLDPTFVEPPGGDLHLAAGSPAVDAADNTAVPAGVTGDLDGLPRFTDDPEAPDTGWGKPPLADMGAYERQPDGPACAEDVTGDGQVGTADLLAVLAAWGPCGGCAADVTGDGQVGTADLLAVLAAWGPCPG